MTEESEVPLTEAQRIIKQHEVIGGLLIDKRKLEKENERLQQQLKEERNKAIDECMKLFFDEDGDFQQYKSPDVVKAEVESLKSDSK